MATGREERMQQRMRGAQRHQVQAASFDILFDAPLPPPAPSTDSASTPTPTAVSSVSRSSAEEVAESPADAPGSGRRRRSIAVRAVARQSAVALQQVVGGAAAELAETVDELSPEDRTTQPPLAAVGSAGGAGGAGGIGGASMFARLVRAKRQRSSAGSHDNTATTAAATADELSSPSFAAVLSAGPPENASSSPLARKSTAAVSRLSGRRSIHRASRASSDASEQAAREAAETTPETKSRGAQSANNVDELSPDQEEQKPAAEVPSSSPMHRLSATSGRQRLSHGRPVATIEEEQPEATAADDDEEEQAEEIDALEAARTIGRKRPRRSTTHEASPELGSDLRSAGPTATADESVPQEEETTEPASPPAKRRRRQQQQQHLSRQSASGQNRREPKGKQTEKARPEKQPVPRKKRSLKKRTRDEDADDDNSGDDDLQTPRTTATPTTRRRGRSRTSTSTNGATNAIPITVQRFVRPRRRTTDDDSADDDDDDELADAIPFSHRSGVNAVDVLAQICHDIVAQKLQGEDEKRRAAAAAVAEAAATTAGGDDGLPGEAAAARRTALVRRAALEAFRQQLTTRLLEQAVAVDTLHALRQRVRAAHREKLALRTAILRVRAERDQVALRMDALRARHQAAAARARKRSALSSAMHDIDLAVEQGRAAAAAGGPPLPSAQQKTAELGNLPLAASRVAEQVGGGGGGALQRIVAFNAFLARAATVLEGRKRRDGV